MSAYFASEGDGWDQNTGRPGKDLFGNAVQVWSILQERPTSVAEAATAFNCDPMMIVEAVRDHYWMMLSGPTDDFAKCIIEHEGE